LWIISVTVWMYRVPTVIPTAFAPGRGLLRRGAVLAAAARIDRWYLIRFFFASFSTSLESRGRR
jgi:hypothetical protein